jgi:hypothetical protein
MAKCFIDRGYAKMEVQNESLIHTHFPGHTSTNQGQIVVGSCSDQMVVIEAPLVTVKLVCSEVCNRRPNNHPYKRGIAWNA